MAIEVDTTSSTAPGGDGDTLTWSHTVGSGSNTILVVCVPVAYHEDNPSSVKYNGEDLTLAHSRYRADSNNPRTASVWYIVSPATGANDITVNYTASVWLRHGIAISLFGVDQDNPVGATAGADGQSNTDPDVDITTQKDNSYIIDNVATRASISPSVGTGQTIINRRDYRGGSSYKQLSTAGATTMSWDIGSGYPWAAVAVEFTSAEVPSTGFLPLL